MLFSVLPPQTAQAEPKTQAEAEAHGILAAEKLDEVENAAISLGIIKTTAWAAHADAMMYYLTYVHDDPFIPWWVKNDALNTINDAMMLMHEAEAWSTQFSATVDRIRDYVNAGGFHAYQGNWTHAWGSFNDAINEPWPEWQYSIDKCFGALAAIENANEIMYPPFNH